MKAVVSGGGTGGHIYPALAIAQRLRNDGVDVLYMGGENSMEAKLASASGFAFFGLRCAGLHRRSLRIVKDCVVNAIGIHQARMQLKKFSPDIVVGTGGYGSAPVLKGAQSLGLTTVLHEQNAFPGLANRLLARQAKAVCLTFPAAAEYFPHPERLHVTGLPIRTEILTTTREQARGYFQIPDDGKPVLLITGGSQGAASLNTAATEAVPVLLTKGIRILFLCGKADYFSRRQSLPEHPDLILRPYLEHMEYALALADLAVARAGASFLAEALACALPTILVPYPYAANDHQRFNAKSLVEQGAAEMIEDSELTGSVFLEHVLALLQDEPRRKEMAFQAKSMSIPDAGDRIAEILYRFVE